jgi:hypothetical protein
MAAAAGPVGISLIRRGVVWELDGVEFSDDLLEEDDWVEVRTADGRFWWGKCREGHFQVRAWRDSLS